MYRTRIVVANELRSYREAISHVLVNLRPDVEVFTTEQEDLDQEVQRLRPDFVVCSQSTPRVESQVRVWVELYRDCGTRSKVSVRGETETVEDIQLTDLLALLDQTTTRDLASTLS
ncbi:MAG: hypothetical protein H0T57_14700 [Rubrobacter sp.]|nr:hypothetical protein [Rubrobacter sp.]MDQ3639283.1 hypothetical protein [Actinomycetota bacterium]